MTSSFKRTLRKALKENTEKSDKNAHDILRITCPKYESLFSLPFLIINSIIPFGQEGCFLFGSSKPYKN